MGPRRNWPRMGGGRSQAGGGVPDRTFLESIARLSGGIREQNAIAVRNSW